MFGNIKTILNHDSIVNDRLVAAAIKRNKNYQQAKNDCEKLKELSYIKQLSNEYSSINSRFKLNLMGLEYAAKNEQIVNKDVYVLKYNNNKMTKEYHYQYKDYDCFFSKNFSLRDTLAYQEHLRWNAFYIMNGYIPMKNSDIKYQRVFHQGKEVFTNTHENEQLRTHACITSQKGMDVFHKEVAKNCYEVYKEYHKDLSYDYFLDKNETFRYDYQLMDCFMQENCQPIKEKE